MLDPYHMVLFNSLISFLVATGAIIYRFTYPKKNINILVLLIIISLLPLVSILRKGTYESGTLSENVQISRSFFETLADGNIIPIWNAAALGGYGSPQHLFQYPLPYYFSSLFHWTGLSYLASVKLLLALSFIGSGITMYIFIKNKYGKIPAFIASLFYLFAPYHLTELHFRATVGVMLSYVFVPLVFYYIDKNFEKVKIKYILLGSVCFALLIISHIAVTFIYLPLLILYIFFLFLTKKTKRKHLFFGFLIFFLGGLFTSFYWLPSLYESRFINNLLFIQTDDFIPFINYLYSPTMFGLLFQGHHGETHFIIGYPHLFISIIGIILLVKSKININIKKSLLFFLFLLLLYILLTQAISKPIWELPLFRTVLNTWKLLGPISFITSVIAAIVTFSILKIKWLKAANRGNLFIIIISLFVIFSTILNWGNRKTIPLDYNQLKKAWTQLTPDAKLIFPPWVDYNSSQILSLPNQPMDIVKGKGSFAQIYRNTTKHEYIVDAETDLVIKENTLYFPGWTVRVNDQNYPFQYQQKPYSGLILIYLKKGLYKIDVVLRNSFIRTVSQILSFISIMTAIIFFIVIKYF